MEWRHIARFYPHAYPPVFSVSCPLPDDELRKKQNSGEEPSVIENEPTIVGATQMVSVLLARSSI